MTAPSHWQEVREWLRWAREDLELAETLVMQGIGVPRQACFTAQQAVEKALKGSLIMVRVSWPRRHDLDELRDLLPAGWALKTSHPSFARLNEYAVNIRYPDTMVSATATDAELAARLAREVWNSLAADLLRLGFDVQKEL